MVRDNGGGIRAEEMERIFAPFFSHKFLGRGMARRWKLPDPNALDGNFNWPSRFLCGTMA